MDYERLFISAVNSGIIDLAVLQKQVEMEEKAKVLAMHTKRIWLGKDNKWRTYVYNYKNERRLIVKNSKEELDDFLCDYYRDQIEEPYLEEVFNMWLEDKLKYHEIKKGSYDKYKTDFKRFFISNKCATDILNTKIRNITEKELRFYIKSTIAEMRLTRKSYNGLAILIKGIFQYAKECEYTDFSVSAFLDDLSLPKRMFAKPDKSKSKVFNNTEIDLIENYVLDEDKTLTGYGILLSYYTGLRPGELSVLKWSDIQSQYIHVHRMEEKSLDENGNVVHKIVDTTKTDAGDREVYLHKKALDILKLIRIQNPFNEFIFWNGKKILTEQAFTNKLYRICDKIGIEKRSLNKMRKTYATRLINSGVDDAVIKQVMGHEDISTTRTYYYCNDKTSDEMARQISNVSF